jgi:porin
MILLYVLLLGALPTQTNQSWYGRWKSRPTLTGDWSGLRPQLTEQGVTPQITFVNIVGKVFHGGHAQGRSFPFLLRAGVLLESDGPGWWRGGSLLVEGVWRSDFFDSPGLTVDYAGAFSPVNDLDNTRDHVQLSRLRFQQVFADGALGLALGKLVASDHFLRLGSSMEFLNAATRLIPTVPIPRYRTLDAHFDAFEPSPVRSQAAPALGLVVWAAPARRCRITAGIFDQRPEEEAWFISAQSRRSRNFSLILETRLHLSSEKYPLNLLVGGWFVNQGAREKAESQARRFSGTAGAYVSAEQRVLPRRGGPRRGLWIFGQLGFAPGRWEISTYWGAGLLYEGLFPSRRQDTTGLSIGNADFSPKMEGETDSVTGEWTPTYGMTASETVVEWFYRIQASRWLSVHHGLMWIRVPKGITDPWNQQYGKDAFLFQVRGQVEF